MRGTLDASPLARQRLASPQTAVQQLDVLSAALDVLVRAAVVQPLAGVARAVDDDAVALAGEIAHQGPL